MTGFPELLVAFYAITVGDGSAARKARLIRSYRAVEVGQRRAARCSSRNSRMFGGAR